MFERIKSVLKCNTFSSINKIGLPTLHQHETTEQIWNRMQTMTPGEIDQLEWTYFEDPDIVGQRLVEWNILHFNQASETPLATEFWKNKLDPAGHDLTSDTQ